MVDPNKLAYAAHLRDTGATIAEIVNKTGITRTSLYRHARPSWSPPPGTSQPPPRPDIEPEPKPQGRRRGGVLESTTWPAGYAPACPTCQQPTTGLRETRATAHGQVVIVAVAEPCRHPVDEHAAALQAGASH